MKLHDSIFVQDLTMSRCLSADQKYTPKERGLGHVTRSEILGSRRHRAKAKLARICLRHGLKMSPSLSRTCASSFNAPTLGAGHNKSVAMRIDPRYDALCASRLSWQVIIFAMLHQLNTWRCA